MTFQSELFCFSTHEADVIAPSNESVWDINVRRSLLPSATKLRRLCFYRRLSVHSWAVCLVGGSAWSGGGLLPGVWGLVSQHALRQTPPPAETATAADGTHQTGMHSCPFLHWWENLSL